MNLSKMLGAQAIAKGCYLLAALFVVSAHGQNYEITPLVGATFGGTMHLEQTGTPNFYAHIADSINFGLAGGYRLEGAEGEGYDVIEFRWMRQNSHLSVHQEPLVPTPYAPPSFRPSISLDHFLGDFTHEFAIKEAPSIQPLVSGSLGAALMSVPDSNAVRFEFGVGAGVKIFPSKHYGFRVKAEYLPIVMHTELQSLVCAGGCVVILNGGIMNQFEVTLGPAFRF
jgi:hypothetical protein